MKKLFTFVVSVILLSSIIVPTICVAEEPFVITMLTNYVSFVLRLICKASIFPISNSSVANDYHFQPMVPSPFLNYGNYRPFLSDILMTVLFCR